MDGWNIRPASQGQHILTWSTDSITSYTSSSWSTALRLAKLSTMLVVVVGSGLLYYEYLHRLRMIEKQEARQRRLVRKLLERQRVNTNPVPIFDVQKSSKLEKKPCLDCQYGRCYRRHNQSGRKKILPPDLTSLDQLYRVWDAVPPASQVRQERRGYQDTLERRVRRQAGDRERIYGRGDPDGGEEGGNINSDDPCMDSVIQSAKEVRRLIRNSSTNSLTFCDAEISIDEKARDSIPNYDEEDSDDNSKQDYTSKTTSDFRELLQLTSIEDTWSDTRSIRHSSVISCSPSRETRRQSVLSCTPGGFLDMESWDWEEEEPTELSVETNKSVDLVIRCGEIVTLDTSIKMDSDLTECRQHV